jgi:hypothetical protein
MAKMNSAETFKTVLAGKTCSVWLTCPGAGKSGVDEWVERVTKVIGVTMYGF